MRMLGLFLSLLSREESQETYFYLCEYEKGRMMSLSIYQPLFKEFQRIKKEWIFQEKTLL